MKKFLLVIGASLFANACSESPPPPPKPLTPANTKQPVAEVKQTPLQEKQTGDAIPLNYSWLSSDEESSELSENPLATNYYVILDGSGSMASSKCSGRKSKMEVAQSSLAVFSKSVPQSANLGMIAFDGRGIAEHIPLGVNNRDRFIQAVNRVQPSSGTPLKSAIKLAYDKLITQGKKQLGYGEYHLVVVTDGIASKNENPTQIVNDLFKDSPVVLHTIGFCIDDNHSLNQPGRAYYKAANNPEALQAGLDNVLAESESFVITAFN